MSNHSDSLNIHLETIFLDLANGDPRVVDRAREQSRDSRGLMHLDQICRHILRESNPGLLATQDAATPHIKSMTKHGLLSEIPHIIDIINLARADNTAPRRVFQRAASLMSRPESPAAAPHEAIAIALGEQQRILELH